MKNFLRWKIMRKTRFFTPSPSVYIIPVFLLRTFDLCPFSSIILTQSLFFPLERANLFPAFCWTNSHDPSEGFDPRILSTTPSCISLTHNDLNHIPGNRFSSFPYFPSPLLSSHIKIRLRRHCICIYHPLPPILTAPFFAPSYLLLTEDVSAVLFLVRHIFHFH